MQDPIHCSECQSIAHELAEAYARALEDSCTREVWVTILNLKTENDVQRAEELVKLVPHHAAETSELRKLIQRMNTPIMLALRKKDTHQALTGHKVAFRLG